MADLFGVRVTGPLQAHARGFSEQLTELGYTRLSAADQLQLMAHLSRRLSELYDHNLIGEPGAGTVYTICFANTPGPAPAPTTAPKTRPQSTARVAAIFVRRRSDDGINQDACRTGLSARILGSEAVTSCLRRACTRARHSCANRLGRPIAWLIYGK